jgi:phospholipid/cholesterol/gamma-HCH transport system substrate-binding protein
MSKVQVAVRIGALVVVAIVGVSFIAFDVLGLRLGTEPFQVTVHLPRGGGLYADGFVTYRGVDVGRIKTLALDPTGATATLDIDPGTKIPANATAHVHELSVAGEQYLDLVPSSPKGPDLHGGSVIGRRHTVVPVSVFTLLSDAGQLITSINASEVKTITTAFGSGFADTGPALRTITVAAKNFIAALQKAQSATVTIINNSGPLLQTAQASGADILSFSQSLQQITATLATSNADVVALLQKGAPTEQALNQIVTQDGAAITQLIKNLAGLSDVAITRQPAVVSLLQQLPIFVNKIAATATGGSVAVQIYYNSANTVCPYAAATPPPPPTEAVPNPELDRACAVTASDLLQRGSANTPVSSGR